MSTVDKRIADIIVKGNGFYPGDHIRVRKIIVYQNAFDGADAYKLVYEGKADPESPYMRNPKTYWEAKP